MRFRGKRHSAVMFELGHAGLRALQVAGGLRRTRLLDQLQLELPLPSVSEDSDPPRPEAAVERLARLLEQGTFRGRSIGVVLSPPVVRFSALRIPDAALSQPWPRLHEALRWEVGRETRTDPARLEVRYWRLPRGNTQGFNVMAVSMPADEADAWHRSCDALGLQLERLDVSACALVRCALEHFAPHAGELWGVLDLGHRQGHLTVVVGRTPAYVRQLSASAGRWTEQIAESFELSPAEAEEMKRSHGILTERRAPRSGGLSEGVRDPDELPVLLFELLRESIDALVREIGLCFSYVNQSYADLVPTRLFLAGGGARLRGLSDYFAAHLDIEALSLAPGTPARPDEESRGSPVAAAAYGGALLDLESA